MAPVSFYFIVRHINHVFIVKRVFRLCVAFLQSIVDLIDLIDNSLDLYLINNKTIYLIKLSVYFEKPLLLKMIFN